jgi:hypothetical protein
VDLLTDGPIEIPEFLDTITANVEAIQQNITDSKDDVAYVFSEHGLFSYLTSVAFPQITPYVSKALSYPTLTDPTTLVLVNQPFVSQDTIDRLGTFTSMVLVGNYTPTGLDYASLTSLQHLRMYYGNIGDVRSSVQSLVRTTRVLRYLEIPTWGTDTIENDAFRATSAVKNTTLQQLVGFEDVTTIGDYAFEYCTGLGSVFFPNVTIVGIGAFEYCSVLTFSAPKLQSVANLAFYSCKNVNFSAPEVKTLGDNAFNGCQYLTVYSPKLETAGSSCFRSGLSLARFPKLTRTGGSAFYECRSLGDVTFPDTATFGGQSFNVTTVSTVRVIGEYQREGGYASYSEPDGNGIPMIWFAFASTGFGAHVTSFYFSLGETAQALPNTSTNKSLFNYISGVLSSKRDHQHSRIKLDATTHGYLDLGAKFSEEGLSLKGPDYLIDTIINIGSTPIVQ